MQLNRKGVNQFDQVGIETARRFINLTERDESDLTATLANQRGRALLDERANGGCAHATTEESIAGGGSAAALNMAETTTRDGIPTCCETRSAIAIAPPVRGPSETTIIEERLPRC